uniref:platelet endothelial cell adhesion molecule isoform X3 n=1 Tax=Scatophagus argus TaxID=75038 RepID=UPI001ED8165A|nr:platelet endothelial cell adhesion molecule isoform X3 [Scatophagus argus]
MGLLLLLISTLLSSYFHPGRVVNAHRSFTIINITLSIEPSSNVSRGTNVTLRCRAIVSSKEQVTLSREYSILKDSSPVHTETSSTSEDFLYPLPDARLSHTGKYKCAINIEGKQTVSEVKKLTVTGLSKPVLHLDKLEVSEGEELTARCTAPGESGSFVFYFYDGSKEILEKKSDFNQVEVNISSNGIHKIHCVYFVLLIPDLFRSEESNVVNVSVTELPITTVLKISPQQKIYEGDQLSISCTISGFVPLSRNFSLYLIQGHRLLNTGGTELKHSMIAQAKDSGEFECKLEIEIGNIVKITTETVTVTELFSVPTLTMSPAEVFQMENMTLTCKSERYAYEILRKEELTYTLDPPQSTLAPKGNGVFSGKALPHDFNYTCATRARGIVKHSKTLTVRPKVSVSKPKISVVDRAVLGQAFKILCQSDGSLPIKYTLMKDKIPIDTITIESSNKPALFTGTIYKPEEINKYTCEAKNSNKNPLYSERLNTAVIEPLANPVLTVIPELKEIPEGNHLHLICGVQGTPPITFKWYREGNEHPLYTTTTMTNNTYYEFHSLSKDHSGGYYCEAVNHANKVVRSEPVRIKVCMALWKKALIGGFCLLAIAVLAVVCVLCFRSKRGKREGAAELSVKPSSAKSDLEFEGNLTHDTKVYNTATVKVDRTTVSVWTKKPPEADAANDEESSVVSDTPDVEYTEVVHPLSVDPARGAADHHDYQGSVEYAELNGDQPEINHYHPERNSYQDLPVPVD